VTQLARPMSDRPVVVKLGGDALASPQRIVAQARRLARRAAEGPVVAVASARRGVTDHLLGLAQEVTSVTDPAAGRPVRGRARQSRAERDRAVATGEIVSASLLALALNELGVPAVSLDAREAGVESRGEFGDARIQRVVPRRLERLLRRGVVPVVTGFQGWQRGRVATLGRGGTDTSAVALTLALGGQRTIFVKEAHGLRTADPELVPDTERIAEAPLTFLSALTAAGAGIVQAEAAALAEMHGLWLEFWSLEGHAAESVVRKGVSAARLRAIATLPGEDEGKVTVLAGTPAELVREAENLRAALADAGILHSEIQPAADGLRFVVPGTSTPEASRALHAAFVRCGPGHRTRRAS
jgi:aspartate kinase